MFPTTLMTKAYRLDKVREKCGMQCRKLGVGGKLAQANSKQNGILILIVFDSSTKTSSTQIQQPLGTGLIFCLLGPLQVPRMLLVTIVIPSIELLQTCLNQLQLLHIVHNAS